MSQIVIFLARWLRKYIELSKNTCNNISYEKKVHLLLILRLQEHEFRSCNISYQKLPFYF